MLDSILLTLETFSLVPDDGVFYGETHVPKTMNFTEGKSSRFDPPMLGHTHVPDMRGISMIESNDIKAMGELTKPHEGRVDHPWTSDREMKRENMMTSILRE